MKKSIRIGILGGSFNPPHDGHLHISKIAYKKLSLNKVIWLISPQNPLKDENITNNFNHRFDLCNELTKEHVYIVPNKMEQEIANRNTQKFYTYNFLKRYIQIYPHHDVYFIMGADNLVNFHKWYRFIDISKMCNIVVIDRASEKYKAMRSKAWAILKNRISFINAKKVDISSTEIRRNLATN